MIDYPIPVLGFCAFSGTGKTTLLKQLIPLLVAEKISVSVIKHAHHSFEIDYPQKDSYELRHAGACKTLIISKNRVAKIEEFKQRDDEPTLQEALDRLDPSNLDIVFVEGFKAEIFPKIELYRPQLNKPIQYPNDPNIIAFASDESMPHITQNNNLTFIDLNQPTQFVDFIISFINSSLSETTSNNFFNKKTGQLCRL